MSEATERPARDHFTVRALRPDDLSFIRMLAQDERVIRFVGDGRPWSDAYLQLRFDDALSTGGTPDREVRWFIAETTAGAPVGLLALTLRSTETEVGYWIAPSEWGKGYATRIVEYAVVLAGRDRPTVPLVATILRDNLASRRVAERVGFTAEPITKAGSQPESQADLTYRRSPIQDNAE